MVLGMGSFQVQGQRVHVGEVRLAEVAIRLIFVLDQMLRLVIQKSNASPTHAAHITAESSQNILVLTGGLQLWYTQGHCALKKQKQTITTNQLTL